MNRLRELRKREKMTAEQMAEVLDVTVRHLYDLEAGKVQLGDTRINFLCDKFNIKADWLLGRDVPEDKADDQSRSQPEAKVAEEEEHYSAGKDSTDDLEGIMVLVASAEGREELKPISPELRSRIINAIREAKRDRQDAITKGEWPPTK